MSAGEGVGSRSNFVRVEGGKYRRWWEEKYGLPEHSLAGYSFFQRGRSKVWIGAREIDMKGLSKIDGTGIPCIRVDSRVWKPTTVAAILLGAGAQRNAFELEENEVTTFLRAEMIPCVTDDPRRAGAEPGYAIARFNGVSLGCGLWRAEGLLPAVPKGRRVALLDF